MLHWQRVSPHVGGMTMDTGLHRVELTGQSGLAGLARLAGLGGRFSGLLEKTPAKYFQSKFIWVPAVLIVGVAAWMLLPGSSGNVAERQTVGLAAAASTEPVQSPATQAAQDGSSVAPPSAPAPTEVSAMALEAIAPVGTSPVDALKISSQSWRRGGLGSKALVTFTLRNDNDYAVKDIELYCSFARGDGRHLTDRTRTIRDAVNMKSRKTFARVHIGFININAERAKCSVVAASHI
jgi:hypothetical protein